jgi:hypothetical protein
MSPLSPAARFGCLLGAGLAVPLFAGLPAGAVSPPAACSSFANSTNQISGSVIFGTGDFTCQIGDKIYSNFKLLADVQNTLKTSGFGFSNTADIYSLSVTPGAGFRPESSITKTVKAGKSHSITTYSDGFYSLGYTITVAGPGNPRAIQDVSTSATSSVIGHGVPAWTKTLIASSSTETLGPVGLTASQTPPPGGLITVGGPLSFATPPAKVDFISSLKVNGVMNNGVFNFNDTITQTVPRTPTDSVPGPLPVMGAGMAFGFSRKLRRRIRQAS